MDRIAERLSAWFGSTPFILLHVIWVGIWAVFHLDKDMLVYLMTIEGIFLVLFVLRAENVQGHRMEASIKQAEKDTKRDLQESVKLRELIKAKK